MDKQLRKSAATKTHIFQGNHRFEHWYANNQVYFITARCRDQQPAFASDEAKLIFWDRFDHYTVRYSFTPWVTSLLDNHDHTLGYLKLGEHLGPMMQRIHGSVSKRVNDTLDTRLTPFWREAGHQTYFDGCIRDEIQARKAYRYTCIQSERHNACDDGPPTPTRMSTSNSNAQSNAPTNSRPTWKVSPTNATTIRKTARDRGPTSTPARTGCLSNQSSQVSRHQNSPYFFST